MSEGITTHETGSPAGDDLDNGNLENRGVKRQRTSTAAPDDDDDDDDKPGRERRKIEIKFIQDKSRRHITFSKRKAGIMKKAYELSTLTGTQVLLLVVSETGLVYTFTTPKLQPLVTKAEGKNLIQACLNAPDKPETKEEGNKGTYNNLNGMNYANEQSPINNNLSALNNNNYIKIAQIKQGRSRTLVIMHEAFKGSFG